jgi:hypothetical protein
MSSTLVSRALNSCAWDLMKIFFGEFHGDKGKDIIPRRTALAEAPNVADISHVVHCAIED